MPRNTDELIDLLDLHPEGANRFIGRHPETLMQRTYGGQVLAQALMAAYGTVPERFAHSLHAYFMRPGNAHDDITYEVEALRDGGTFSTRRVTALQDNKVLFAMSASFHDLESSELNHEDIRPPQLPDPDDCPRLIEVFNERFGKSPIWHEWDALDIRFIGDSGANGTIPTLSHGAHMRVWAKTSGDLPDDLRLHHAALAYLSDLTLLSVSTVPHPVAFMSNTIQTASIDHSMWFHRTTRADDWLLYDMISPTASHALGFGMGRLFQGAELVATCAQEGLVRQVEGRPLLQ